MAELLEQHRRAVEAFDERVQAVGDEQWHAATPCEDWDVRDLVHHLVVEQLWLPPLIGGATIDDVGDRFDGDQVGDDPKGAWRAAADAALDALRAPDVLDRTVHLSYGERDARGYVLEMTADLVVHTWDLARAIGADERLPPDLVELVQDYAEPNVQAMVDSGLFDPPLDPPGDADPQTELLAVFGRRAW
jgi:uncharacterized protein (TIGR03086 family)